VAIVAVFLAGLLWFLATRFGDRQLRQILLGLAMLALAFAVYLAIFEPRLAWDLHWVGRMVLRLFGVGFHHMLR